MAESERKSISNEELSGLISREPIGEPVDVIAPDGFPIRYQQVIPLAECSMCGGSFNPGILFKGVCGACRHQHWKNCRSVDIATRIVAWLDSMSRTNDEKILGVASILQDAEMEELSPRRDATVPCTCIDGQYNQFCKRHGLGGYYQRKTKAEKNDARQ